DPGGRLCCALYWIGCGAAVEILAIGCVYGVQEDVSDMFADKVEGVVAFASVVSCGVHPVDDRLVLPLCPVRGLAPFEVRAGLLGPGKPRRAGRGHPYGLPIR